MTEGSLSIGNFWKYAITTIFLGTLLLLYYIFRVSKSDRCIFFVWSHMTYTLTHYPRKNRNHFHAWFHFRIRFMKKLREPSSFTSLGSEESEGGHSKNDERQGGLLKMMRNRGGYSKFWRVISCVSITKLRYFDLKFPKVSSSGGGTPPSWLSPISDPFPVAYRPVGHTVGCLVADYVRVLLLDYKDLIVCLCCRSLILM